MAIGTRKQLLSGCGDAQSAFDSHLHLGTKREVEAYVTTEPCLRLQGMDVFCELVVVWLSPWWRGRFGIAKQVRDFAKGVAEQAGLPGQDQGLADT